MPTYIYNGAVVHRQTGRHAAESRTRPWLRRTKDGRYVKAFLFWGGRDVRVITEMLDEAGVEHDLDSDAYRELRKTFTVRGAGAFQRHDRQARRVADGRGSLPSRASQRVCSGRASDIPKRTSTIRIFRRAAPSSRSIIPSSAAISVYPVSVATDGKDRVTGFTTGAPRLGQHTREVLAQIGLTATEIEALAAHNTI